MFASLTEKDFWPRRVYCRRTQEDRQRLTALAKCIWDEVHYAAPRNEQAIALWLEEMHTIHRASKAAMSVHV